MSLRKLFVASVSVTTLALSLALATSAVTPAQATGAPTLPSNQNLFAIDCDGYHGSVWSVDTTNANSTLVGAGQPNNNSLCGGGFQVNPVDGQAYGIIYGASSDTYLAKVNTTTGDITKVVSFSGLPVSPWQLMVTNTGNFYVSTAGGGFGLYAVNPATGATTLQGFYGVYLGAMAYNPVDDTIYGWTYRGVAHTIDPSTGGKTASPAHDLALTGSPTCPSSASVAVRLSSVVFDANGNPWFESDTCTSSLMVQDFATGIAYYQGQFNDTSHALYSSSPSSFYTESIVITTDPAPTLSAGDSLFAMASNGSGKGLGSLDVATGAGTGLATARATTPHTGDVFTGGAYDPTTGTAYVINEINASNQTLQTVDPVTGVLSTVAIMWKKFSGYPYVRSIAIADDGLAYAIVDNRVLYSLNLATAKLTFIGDTGRSDLPSLAVNRRDGLLYAVDGANGVFTLNTTTGAATKVGDNAADMCGFQIDRAGVAWYTACGGHLFSATNLTDIAGSSLDHGAVSIDGLSPRVWAILYVPALSSLPAPTVPRTVAAGTATATSVPLSWTVPVFLNGGTVTNYLLHYKVSGASSWSTFTRSASTSTTATVTGLTGGTSYQFQVAAVTTAGTSAYSVPVSKSTLTALSGVTSAPRTLKAGMIRPTSMVLRWKVPVSLNGGLITDYIIQYRVAGDNPWVTFPHAASAVKLRMVTGLKARTRYEFQVAAQTVAGNSDYSAVLSKATRAR